MDLITKIIKDKIPCYFISPHLDDAILSAGGLIDYLKDKTKVEINTVFTEASAAPYTYFCRKFMSIAGYKDKTAETFFRDRRNEDAKIFRKLQIPYKHLGFVDAGWRKRKKMNKIVKILGRFIPELLHLYPLEFNFRSGRVVKADNDMIADLERTIISKTKKKAMIFCPISVGDHVDHVIVNDICKRIFPSNQLIFWTDFPYSTFKNVRLPEFVKSLQKFKWSDNLQVKKDLILQYKTQEAFLFPNGLLTLAPEIYYSELS